MHIALMSRDIASKRVPFFRYKESAARCVSFSLIRMLFLIREYLEAAGAGGRIWTHDANHADIQNRNGMIAKPCLPTGGTIQQYAVYRTARNAFISERLAAQSSFGHSTGRIGFYARITLNTPHRMDVITKNFFGSESQIRTGDQRIMIPLL